jgi:GTP-binding protein HflX
MELFERPAGGECAVLVSVGFGARPEPDVMQEFAELASSAGALPAAHLVATRVMPDSRTFIGKGKVEELKQLVAEHAAELVIVDHQLTPAQERNLERELQCRVLDRAGLILDIFAQRARSFEGKLQVELAQLQHLSTRLVRGWTHLERQKGGIGLRGPGETQLETDRRLIGQRITRIEKRLEKVNAQRELGRKSRRRAETLTVSLVGYTNAGKSSLFNQLTAAGVYAQDQLFATLDPTLRRLTLPGNRAVVLADTVGFISRLPHELVAAFRSTLQETIDADLLVHVVDAANPAHAEQITEVNAVLAQIGAQAIPQLMVMNKIDLVEELAASQELDNQGKPARIWVSSKTGEGIELLLHALVASLNAATVHLELQLPPAEGALRAALFREADIQQQEYLPSGDLHLTLGIPSINFAQLRKRFPQLTNFSLGTE